MRQMLGQASAQVERAGTSSQAKAAPFTVKDAQLYALRLYGPASLRLERDSSGVLTSEPGNSDSLEQFLTGRLSTPLSIGAASCPAWHVSDQRHAGWGLLSDRGWMRQLPATRCESTWRSSCFPSRHLNVRVDLGRANRIERGSSMQAKGTLLKGAESGVGAEQQQQQVQTLV